MAKQAAKTFVPFVATEETRLTKKQRKENRKNGYNLDGSVRVKNDDGSRRKDRTYRSLEQRQQDALAEAQELGERIQMAEFAEDVTIKCVSSGISVLRKLAREYGIGTAKGCVAELEALRAKRIEELRAAK